MTDTLPFIAALVLAYLLGSIPFGLLLTRLTGAGDLRKIGSGNIGATNVLRTGRKGLAAATLLLDGGKGAMALLLGAAIAGPTAGYVAGLFAVLGHLFPVWLGFKGGKGVATGLGVLIAANPVLGLGCGAIWLAAAWLLRISSVAALTAFGLAPILALVVGVPLALLLVIVAIAVLIFERHRGNISRLMAGTEPRIGDKSIGGEK